MQNNFCVENNSLLFNFIETNEVYKFGIRIDHNSKIRDRC